MPWVASPPTRPSSAAIASRSRGLRGASYSDVHLFHPQTPTEHILANLRRAFPDNEETAALDLIFMGGDLFDAGVAYADGAIPMVEEWALSHLNLCAKHHIVFRALEGTHSHDRNQSRMFERLIQQHRIPIDFAYVTQVSVEKHADLGISILYVPDFTTIDETTMWEKVQEAMAVAGVTEVDYANIHGAFSYQMPAIPDVQRTCHRMERYLKIVKQYLFSGHIHLPSVYERIYCNGSMDRLNHGEQEPKGHWRFHVPTNGQDVITFVETANAMRYDTVDCKTLGLDEAMRQVEAHAASLPPGSHLRVEAERSHPIFLSMGRLRQGFPFLHWTMKPVGVSTTEEETPALPAQPTVRTSLTAETVFGVLHDRMVRHGVDPTLMAHAEHVLIPYLSP